MRLSSSIACFLYLLASTRKASIVEATSSVIEHNGDWQSHRVTEQASTQSPGQSWTEAPTNDAAWIFDPVACFGVGRENSIVLSYVDQPGSLLTFRMDWGDGYILDGGITSMGDPLGSRFKSFSHTYDAPGTYEPRFIATFENGTILPTAPLGEKFIVSENNCEIVNPPPKPDYAPVEWVTQVNGCGWTPFGRRPPSVNRIALVVSEDYGGQNILINGTWDDGDEAFVVETSEVPADGTTLFFEHTYSAAGDYSPMFSAHLEDGAIIEAYLYTPWKMRIFHYHNNIAHIACDKRDYSFLSTSDSSVIPHGRPFAQYFLALLSFILFAL